MPEALLDHLSLYWTTYVAILISVVVFVSIIAVFVSISKNHRRFQAELHRNTSWKRVYVIDFRHAMVRCFHVNDPKRFKTMTLTAFYDLFPGGDQQRVKNWIEAIADVNTKTPNYLETDFFDHRAKEHYYSMLQLLKASYEDGLIHLESHLFKFINVSAEEGNPVGLISLKTLQNALENETKKRGCTYVFRFIYRKIQDKGYGIDAVAFGEVKNALAPFASKGRMLSQLSQNCLVLTDFAITEKSEAMALAHQMILYVERALALKGLLSSLDFRVSMVEHGIFQLGNEHMLEAADNLSEEAFTYDDRLIVYNEGHGSHSILSESNYRTEVERIIQDNKIAIGFRPIIASKTGKITGYFVKASPVNTYFDSMDDLYEYAVRSGDDRNLFSMVAHQTVPTYVNQVPSLNWKLFYPVRLVSRAYMLQAFSFTKSTKAKDARFVFLFSEDDIKDRLGQFGPDDFIAFVRTVKAAGFEVGLMLDKGELQLPDDMYFAFDSFVCSFAFAGTATNMDVLLRSQLHSMVEKLLKYDRPIIATDVDGWMAVELLMRSGLEFISSDSVAPYDRMILPPAQKAMKRIKDIGSQLD